jgi:integrase
MNREAAPFAESQKLETIRDKGELMASVRKRIGKRGVSWICDYVTPDGQRKRKSFKMKKQAVSYMNKVGVDIDQGTFVDPDHYKKQTLKMLVADYEKNFKHQRGWYTSKKYHLDVIRDKFGEDTRLMQITYKDLETFRNELKQTATKHDKPRTDASVNRCMAALRHMMGKAVSWNMLKISPFSQGESLHIKENNERLRYLSESEIDNLLAECHKQHLRDIVECAINSGMRKGEILNLEWSQIRNGHIYLQKTKSNKRREIPINEDLAELFKRIRQRQHLTSKYVFTYDGARVESIKTAFNAALKRAGIEDFRFHDLRHTFASHFIMRGGDLKSLQELLGHADIKTTMRYAHLSKAHKEKAVNLLNGLTAKSNEKSATSQIVPKTPIFDNSQVAASI